MTQLARRVVGACSISLALIAVAACERNPTALPTPSASAASSVTGPTATPGVTAGPGQTATPGPSAPPVPGCTSHSATLIPDSALVHDVFDNGTRGEEKCLTAIPDNAYEEFLPNPCGVRGAFRDGAIKARRGIQVIFDDLPGNRNGQASIYRHSVTLFDNASTAKAYLAQVRASVKRCPDRKVGNGWTFKYAVVAGTYGGYEGIYAGDEFLQLTITHVSAAPVEGVPSGGVFRVVIARVGAKVSVVMDVGWEGAPSYSSAITQAGMVAVDFLQAWQ